MNQFVAVSVLLTAMLLHGCEPAATFDKPQPDNVQSLNTFPERIQGKYLSADQASILTVAEKLITRQYGFDFKVHKDSIGASNRLTGDTLMIREDGTKEKVIVNGDTVIQHVQWTDTLFRISADQVVKSFKGYYFLNHHYQDNAWEVKKFSLRKGVLTVGRISGIDDIQKLKELTETTADTVSTHFTLTRRQFKKFVRQEGFGDRETFTRIKETGR